MPNLARIMGGVLASVAMWHLTSCSPQTAPIDADAYPAVDRSPTPHLTEGPEQPPQNIVQNPSNIQAVTFYKDILPLLTTNLPDRQYECTQCHASYADPKVVAKARVVDDIIASIESGFMPMNEGPRMRKNEIEIFKLWRRSGMQIGNPGDSRPTTQSSKVGSR